MRDTPRTDEQINGKPCTRFEYLVGDSLRDALVPSQFARQLERELNAANDRIKRLEAVVNDPHALWTNWLRGDVKLPAGIGDVRQYQDRIKRLEREVELLRLYGNKDCTAQADEVLRIKRLEEAGDALYELCDPSPIQFDLVDQIPQRLKAWEEAKEDKP